VPLAGLRLALGPESQEPERLPVEALPLELVVLVPVQQAGQQVPAPVQVALVPLLWRPGFEGAEAATVGGVLQQTAPGQQALSTLRPLLALLVFQASPRRVLRPWPLCRSIPC